MSKVGTTEVSARLVVEALCILLLLSPLLSAMDFGFGSSAAKLGLAQAYGGRGAVVVDDLRDVESGRCRGL